MNKHGGEIPVTSGDVCTFCVTTNYGFSLADLVCPTFRPKRPRPEATLATILSPCIM